MKKTKKENQTSNPTLLVAGADGTIQTRPTNQVRIDYGKIDKLEAANYKAFNIGKIDANDNNAKFGLTNALAKLTPAELLALGFYFTSTATKYSEKWFVDRSYIEDPNNPDEEIFDELEYFKYRIDTNKEANKIIRDVFNFRGDIDLWNYLGIEPTP